MRNLKRALSLAMATFMLLGMMVVGAGAVSISDFSDGEKIVNQEAVTVLTTLNVLNGRDDGTYDPEGVVTRGEMAKMICTVLNGGRTPQLGNVTTSFSDTKGHWAETFIAYCANLGIIAGYGDGSFLPNATVTAAEASKMLLVALGYKADVEGYVGANWQINVDVAANQNNLYNALGTLNTNDGLSRDNAAQMVFNALNAQMVEYKYVITGNVDNSITTKPQITSEGLGTLLMEKFKADKLEAVVLSNEHASVDSNNYSAAEDEGETTLEIISANGVALKDSFTDTYKVATTEDMLGQRVALYVKTNTNTVGYDADNTIVIGTPIVVTRNKVVEKNDGTNLADLLDDNSLDVNADTKYLVNYGGYYGGMMYGADPYKNDVLAANKGNDVKEMDRDQFDTAAKCVGVDVKLIDNDGDKKVDFALAIKHSYGVINKYSTADKGAVRVQGFFNEGEYKTADAIGFEDVAKDDLVLFTEYGGKVYLEKPETQSAKLDAYSTSKKNVTLDGTVIKWSGLNGKWNNDVRWIGEYVTDGGVLSTTATYYKDSNGYVFGVTETDESLLTYAVLLGFENQIKGGTGNLGSTARAKVLLADGTVGTYDVAAINGKSVTNCTAPVSGVAGTASNGTPDKTTYSDKEVGFSAADLDGIYTYTINDNKQIRLVKKAAVEFDSTGTASTMQYLKGESTFRYTANKAVSPNTNGSYAVTDKTVFLYEKANGNVVRYQGRTAPSIVSAVGSSTALTLTTGISGSAYANSRGEALVVFLNGVNPIAEFEDNWAYVYKEKVTQVGENFLVDAIIDGKVETFTVESAVATNGTTNLITKDQTGSTWGHLITVGLYNYSKDGEIYALKQVNVPSDNTVSGQVSSIRSNYIRVTDFTNTDSYTVTDKTKYFESRMNKDASEVSSANQGDKVTVVYNGDKQAVYVFITEFSYNIIDSDYIPDVSKTTDNTSLTTKGGTIGSVTAANVAGKGLSYQWYKTSATTATGGNPITDADGYIGARTANLSAKEGTLAIGDHYFYCVVTGTDANGVTATEKSTAIKVTIGTATEIVLAWADAQDFNVSVDDSFLPLEEIDIRGVKGVVIPASASKVTIWDSAASWTTDDYVTFNSKTYKAIADKTIELPIADVKAVNGQTIVKDSSFAKVTTYNLTTNAGVTGTWALGTQEGVITAATATAVPEGATVTLTGLSANYYSKIGATDYVKAGETFVMGGAAVSMDTDKYHKVNATVTINGNDLTQLGGITVAATVPANTYVKNADTATVTFTLGGTGTATAVINATLDTLTGAASGTYASAAQLLASNDTQATDISGKADTVTFDDTVTTADVTLSYTLTAAP